MDLPQEGLPSIAAKTKDTGLFRVGQQLPAAPLIDRLCISALEPATTPTLPLVLGKDRVGKELLYQTQDSKVPKPLWNKEGRRGGREEGRSGKGKGVKGGILT